MSNVPISVDFEVPVEMLWTFGILSYILIGLVFTKIVIWHDEDILDCFPASFIVFTWPLKLCMAVICSLFSSHMPFYGVISKMFKLMDKVVLKLLGLK